MKAYTNRWKDTLCSLIGRINLVINDILHRVIHRLSSILSKYGDIFMIEQIVLKVVLKNKIIQIAKTITRRNNRAGGIYTPWFEIYYKLKSSRQYGTGTKTDV